MKKILMTLALAASTLAIAAEQAEPTVLKKCDKPIASVMVGNLACKAANCNGMAANPNNLLAALLAASGQTGAGAVSGVGAGIRDMFVTVLQESGCVELQDRDQMDEIAAELKRAGKEVKVQQADYIISGALTTIEMETDRSRFGGGFIPIVGAISKTTQKATLGLDMRLVDVNSAKVVDTRRYTTTSEKSSWGAGGGGIGIAGGAAVGFGGSMSSLKGTSLEVVAREAVIQAANGVAESLAQAKAKATPVAEAPAQAPATN